MIISKIQGGLGNQLFQYAFGRALAVKHNAPLKLEKSYFDTQGAWPYRLDFFNLVHSGVASPEEVRTLTSKKTLFDKLKLPHWRPVVKDNNKSFNSLYLRIKPPVLLTGYYQSDNYFSSIKDKLQNEITVKPEFLSATYHTVLKELTGNTISLHVRRGDYIKVGAPLASLDYYKQAVGHMSSLVSNPHFIVMSDDIEWVKDNLKIDSPCLWIDKSIQLEDYETMLLMSSCHHHIIANSTFSWWGAWLNKRSDKIVIYPSVAKKHLNKDLMPNSWTEL